jgi:hypothetical protein
MFLMNAVYPVLTFNMTSFLNGPFNWNFIKNQKNVDTLNRPVSSGQNAFTKVNNIKLILLSNIIYSIGSEVHPVSHLIFNAATSSRILIRLPWCVVTSLGFCL